MSIIEDIQRRSAHIHWPDGIVPEQADLFAHNDIVIAAPPEDLGASHPRHRLAGLVLQRPQRRQCPDRLGDHCPRGGSTGSC